MSWAVWLLGGAGAVLSLAGNIPAILAVLDESFVPQVLSWTGWAGIMVIGGWGSLRASAASGAYVLACAGGCLAVAVLALRVPASKRQPPVRVRLPGGRRVRLDLVCLPGAVAGLTLLALVRDPGWSVGVSVVTDAVLYVPTFADGWRAPAGQPVKAYLLFAAGAAAASGAVLLRAAGPAAVPPSAAAVPLFAALAYPLYLLASDGAMSVLVTARRAVLRPPSGPGGYYVNLTRGYPVLSGDIMRNLGRGRRNLHRDGLPHHITFYRDPGAAPGLRAAITAAWAERNEAGGRDSDRDEWDRTWELATEAAVMWIGGQLAAWDLAAPTATGDAYRVLAGQVAQWARRYRAGRLLELAIIEHALAAPPEPRWWHRLIPPPPYDRRYAVLYWGAGHPESLITYDARAGQGSG